MIPDDKQYQPLRLGQFQINSNWQAYGTALYSHDENHFVIQPVPISNLFTVRPDGDIPRDDHAAADEPVLSARPRRRRGRRWPAAQRALPRASMNGIRDTTDTNEHYQFVGGIKGSWAHWDWDVVVLLREGKTKEQLNGGFPLYSQLLPLLNSGTVNLFGPNTPDDLDAGAARPTSTATTFNGKSRNYGVQGKTSGEIFQLPAGPLALAFGAEYRKEKLDADLQPGARHAATSSGFGGNYRLSRRQTATTRRVYGELNIPLLKTLEAQRRGPLRPLQRLRQHDQPEGQPALAAAATLLLRGSYGTGFLAPSLYQLLHAADQRRVGHRARPTRSAARSPTTRASDCNTQFHVLFGGNPRPAAGRVGADVTFGIVFEPITRCRSRLDYFKLNLKNAITTGIPVATILGDLDQFGQLRDARSGRSEVPRTCRAASPSIDADVHQPGRRAYRGSRPRSAATVRRRRPGAACAFDLAGTYYMRYDAQNPTAATRVGVSNASYGARRPASCRAGSTTRR